MSRQPNRPPTAKLESEAGSHPSMRKRVLGETRRVWPGLSTYSRFEHVISLVLTLLISIVITASVIELTFRILQLLISGLLHPAQPDIFQSAFSMIFTVLIALEFNHSIISVLERKGSIIQVKTVVLIALLALVRKFIILDPSHVQPTMVIGLAVALLALGAVHWLLRDQDRKDDERWSASASPTD
jgi:uncharacterized membrane protein (DUF373 family)